MPDYFETTMEKLKKEYSLSPQESLLERKSGDKKLFIGLPHELTYQEKRISLTPNSVRSLSDLGHRILIESNAGDGANFHDSDYIEAGAEIVHEKDKVYGADILLKAAPISEKELALLQNHQIIISPILQTKMTKHVLKSLMEKKLPVWHLNSLKEIIIYFHLSEL